MFLPSFILPFDAACMDDDVREAMCNPDYDNGELEDDIMQQMMALAENDNDEEETFDYSLSLLSSCISVTNYIV